MGSLNGFYLVNKPEGPSSAAVVGRLKWLLKQSGQPKNIKIGHGGTLDPLACGLLPIGVGRGTKALQTLLEGPKTYAFTVMWGSQTTTDDREGEVLATSPTRPTEAHIRAILPRFTGEITQTPPVFSAMKVGGRRAYKLARSGEEVILQPRQITIHSLEILELTPQSATFAANVSKGTYIRVLGRDLALALGTVGHITMLRRTVHGPFRLEQAVSLENLDKALQSGDIATHLLPLDVPPAG